MKHRRTPPNALRRRCSPALLLALTLASIGGCTARTLDVTLRPGVRVPPRCAVILLADGVSSARLDALLQRGELPNLQRVFIAGGTRFQHAIAPCPSVTYAGVPAILTGCDPRRNAVLGNCWFDRATLTLHDYDSIRSFRRVNDDLATPTIFELLHDEFTVNVFCHTRRGVDHNIDHLLSNGLDWWLGGYVAVDRRTGRSVRRIVLAANREGRWPILSLFYFPGIDEIGHLHGPDSPQYAEALRNLDASIGLIHAQLAQLGVLDRTVMVLVSDHGAIAAPSGQRFALGDRLRQRTAARIEVRAPEEDDEVHRRRIAHSDAVLIVQGDRSAVLHVRSDAGWRSPASDAALARFGVTEAAPLSLFDAPAVGMICTRSGPHAVRIRTRSGAWRAEWRKRDEIEYRLMTLERRAQGPDAMPALDEQATNTTFRTDDWQTGEAWLQATADGPYPNFVPQICDAFRSPNAGDAMIFPSDGWLFVDHDGGGHGGPLAAETSTWLFVAGPGIGRGRTLHAARLVDIVPTLLDLLGRAPPRSPSDTAFDGRSRAGALRDVDPRRDVKAPTP